MSSQRMILTGRKLLRKIKFSLTQKDLLHCLPKIKGLVDDDLYYTCL